MDTDNKPEAYGVFKPVGHVIASFPTDADAQGASQALKNEGYDDVVFYAPDAMLRQADADIANAGVLASLGQELNLVKAHRELAAQGFSFLVIDAPDDDDNVRVAAIARQFNATRAQKYGRLVIEELIEVGSGEAQVGESPDRGLDAQTPSGNEEGTPDARR